jgi:hypothetical protein
VFLLRALLRLFNFGREPGGPHARQREIQQRMKNELLIQRARAGQADSRRHALDRLLREAEQDRDRAS